MPVTFADREMSCTGGYVHKLKAKDETGEWAYYFVHVSPKRERDFMKAIQGDGMIKLDEFGEIIASCYGEQPSDEIRQYLKSRFDFDV